MPRPVCVPCRTEYRVERNDVVAEEMANFGSYRLWCVDLWRCPGCGHEILSGWGREAYAEHWQEDYIRKVAMHPERIRFGEKPIKSDALRRLGEQGDGRFRVEKVGA